jgi:GNAT superfamily N-acetyltransferase
MTDARVRPANVDDAGEIARIQLLTWQVAYSDVLPKRVLDELDTAEAAQAWARTLTDGPARVHLATEDGTPVGFCVSGPAPEDEVAAADGGLPQDAERVGLIGTLLVEPRWGRRGHGGRLLATAAEALRADGASRGIAWVPEADEASVAFYTGVGWATDGTVRTLDADGQPLREVRLTGTLDLRLDYPAD